MNAIKMTEKQNEPTFKIMLTLLALLLIIGSVHSQGWYEEGGDESVIEPQFSRWIVTVGVVLIFVFAVMVILYLIGMLLASVELQAIAKSELMQILATAIIIALVYGALQTAGSISASWFGAEHAGTGSLYNITMQRIGSVESLTDNYMEKLYDYNDEISEQASKSGSAYFWGVGFTDSSCSALNSASAMINTGIQIITLAAFDVTAVKLLIELGFKYIFPFFLTFGVLCRSFAFTRRWGGILMAIAIAFYPILPMTFTFFDIVAEDFLIGNYCPYTNDYITVNNTCHISNFKTPYCFEFDTEYIWDILPSIKTVTNKDVVEHLVAIVAIRIIFVTVMVLFALLTFISAVAGSIGSYIDLSPLVRLI